MSAPVERLKGPLMGEQMTPIEVQGYPGEFFLFWYISFLIFGVVGERGVPKRAERDLGIEIPGFERGG